MADSADKSPEALERLRHALAAARELSHIQFAMESYSATARIQMLSYYHYPPVGAVDFGPDIQIYAFGWPQDWVDTYLEANYIHVDPVPRAAIRQTLPFWWSEVDTMIDLDAEEKAYLLKVRSQGFGIGLGVPVFGPSGRNGYYAAGFGTSGYTPDESQVAQVHAACQIAHLRFCDLILESLPEHVSLSDRERQILGLLVRGQSNQMIATKLKISSNTVDTYVRRCFEKLDVHDRMTAGLRGLALGLVA
jgi:DNA-binding CsgD family transcriptional regulator